MPQRHFLCCKFTRIRIFPIILDLVEDRVRNRYYTALLVMVAVSLTFSIAVSDQLVAPQDYNDDTGMWKMNVLSGQGSTRTDLQMYLVLVSVLLIPVFMANSLWHRSWWMVTAIPLLVVLLLLGYTAIGEAQRFKTDGNMDIAKYYVMASIMFMVTVGILVLFFTVLAVDKLIHRKIKKDVTFNYAEKKQSSCYKYTKARLPLGVRNFKANAKQKEIDAAAAIEASAKTYHEQQLKMEQPEVEETTPEGFKQKMKYYGNMVKDLSILTWQVVFGEIQRVYLDARTFFVDAFTFSDEFYYPQRMLVAAFVSFLIALMMVLFALYVNDEVYFWISRVAFWLKQAIDVVSKGNGALAQLPPQGFTSEAVQGQEVLQKLYDNMILWRGILYRSGIVSSILAFLISAISLPFFMNHYRKHIRLLRQGKYFFDTAKTTVLESPNFIGIKSVHCGFGFILLWGVFQIVVTIFTSPFTNDIKNFVGNNFFLLFGSPIITYIFVYVFIRYFCLESDGRTIYHRRYWSVFEFLWVFYYVIAAFTVALVRFAIAQVTLIVRYINTNSRLYSTFIADAGYRAYLSMLIMDHQHNNPILRCFCDLLKQTLSKARLEKKESFARRNPEKFRITIKTEYSCHKIIDESVLKARKEAVRRERIINRWWLLITLYHNPQLAKDRRYPYRPPLTHTLTHPEFVLNSSVGSDGSGPAAI